MDSAQAQALIDLTGKAIAAASAQGILLTQCVFWLQVSCWLLLALVFLSAVRTIAR